MMRQSRAYWLSPRNQPRKRLDIAAKAFGLLAQKYDDVRYYHHAGVEDAGWNIVDLSKRYGWSDKLILTRQDLSPQRYVSDEVLNIIYNSADVGINTSMGEGWGLCFEENTEILTEQGYKPIKSVLIGDYVFDRDGNLTRVTNVLEREFDGDLVKVRASGFSGEIYVTPEHPFLVDHEYVEAQDLQPGMSLFKPQVNFQPEQLYLNLTNYGEFHSDQDHVYIYRWWNDIGDKVHKRNLPKVRKMFNSYLNKNEAKKLPKYIPINEDLAEILAHILCNLPPNTYKFNYDKYVEEALYNIFKYTRKGLAEDLFPTRPIVKALNSIAFSQHVYMQMDYETLGRFLGGVIRRSGYVHPTNERLVLGAMNKDKQKILKIAMLRLGIAWSEFVTKDGTVYFSLDKKYLDVEKGKYTRNWMNRKEAVDGYYYEILSVERVPYAGTVYNLETTSHTYTAWDYAVHNCNMEHAVLGKAQIVPANSANLELYAEDRGILVPIHHYDTTTTILTEGAVVHPQHVFGALDFAYNNREKIREIGEKSREYFLQDKFRWENISRQFREILEE